jgi:hypothetical protein
MGILTSTKVNIGGLNYSTQNGSESWSLNRISDDIFRFELRPGDQWKYDSSNKERTELSGSKIYEPGETLTVSYSFMVEPGQANTAEYLLIGQFHADDGFTSPPLAVELVGEKMAIVVRYKVAGESSYEMDYIYVDSQNIQRGKYYNITITANFENDNDGFLNVWRDGQQIVNYDGPIGYGYGVYWKHGIYRRDSDQTIAVNFKDFSLTTDDGGVVIVGTDNSDTVATGEAPAGQPTPTDNGDVIDMKGSNDLVVAGDGSDVILSGAGNDSVDAGKGNDKVYGGSGNDKLKGGAGKDVFKFTADFGKNVIRDFKPNKDKVLFDDVYDSYRDLKGDMRSYKGGTLIKDGDDSILLKKVKLAKLDGGDFLFD